MNWLNIKIAQLRSEAFLHATNAQKGQWLELCAHCCTQHNSGRIKNSKNWAPTQWIKITGSETPDTPCTLWHWHKDDLIVEFFPLFQQEKFIRQQGSAREANRIRWGKKHGYSPDPDEFKPEIGM